MRLFPNAAFGRNQTRSTASRRRLRGVRAPHSLPTDADAYGLPLNEDARTVRASYRRRPLGRPSGFA
jgi:hypothetical protein